MWCKQMISQLCFKSNCLQSALHFWLGYWLIVVFYTVIEPNKIKSDRTLWLSQAYGNVHKKPESTVAAEHVREYNKLGHDLWGS